MIIPFADQWQFQNSGSRALPDSARIHVLVRTTAASSVFSITKKHEYDTTAASSKSLIISPPRIRF
jgi:hypothetical protein